ncbi:MAG: SEL1-like repeat protein [Planctomycetes bacterium]|nr:SEL1-like repeat protein [Planctomycetota bacterium]
MSEPADMPNPREVPRPPVNPHFAPDDPVDRAENWLLVRELGRGGFGEVWLARHEWKDELRAVKFCTHPDVRHRLIGHEKTVLLRVMRNAGDHPNIVPLLEYSLRAEIPWLMYEYVEGGTLADLIGGSGALSPGDRLARAVRTLHAIAGALARLHQLDPPIVHRDLKPHNVLMSGAVPRVTDFGLGGVASAASASDETASFVDLSVRLPTLLRTAGSLRYASPEQMHGSAPNPRDDVYALGVIAFQMAMGDLKTTPGADAADELREAGIPDAFAQLVLRSVAVRPERRPRDAAEWQLQIAPLLNAPAAAPVSVALSDAELREQAETHYRRGEECYTGRGALQDYAKAREWYEKAAALGHAEAEFRLGWLHDHGRGVPRDAVAARAWYERAAAQGNANAQYNLGVLYKKGRGVPRDPARARWWWEQAAANGHAGAQANLGAIYHNGEGVSQDLAKARVWYERAALQGDANAQAALGGMYDDGEGGPRDAPMARVWYERAAVQGDANAQYNLGVLYDSGDGVPQDFATAREWWVKAAARGHAGAQYNLGALHHNGEGVPQDFTMAREWYEKAAAQGDSDAQYNLGALYEGGHGVAKNAARAREWYRRAAEQGHADAKLSLERLEAE